MSVPKLSSVLFQIRLEGVCCLTEVVSDPLVADELPLSSVVEEVPIGIVVADELDEVCPLPQGIDEDLAISCYFHFSTSSFGGFPFLSS